MQTILEKACQAVASENMHGSQSFKGAINPGLIDHIGSSSMNFANSFQDMHLYGGDQLEHIHQLQMERTSSLEGMLPVVNDGMFLGKKRSANLYGGNGKNPLVWDEDIRMQELGNAAAACMTSQDDPFMSGANHDLDSMGDAYESKPVLSGEGSNGEKNFEVAMKLGKLSPDQRTPLEVIKSGGSSLTRNLSYG